MRKIIISLLFCGIGSLSNAVYSQELSVPKMWIRVVSNDSITQLVDIQNNLSKEFVTPSLTNYNPSVLLGDSSVYSLVYPNLRDDSVVTIFTAYQTESDELVGLWEIDSDTNRQLWLNSQRSSLKSTNIRYKRKTEKGVIVNTIRTEYPTQTFDTIFSTDGTFSLQSENSTDTLYVGKCSKNYFDNGSFCEWLYFTDTIELREQQKWESYLAIKYGATLSNIYVNSNSDTLWNSKADSIYNIKIGGIGRDDSLTLNQPKTTIYKDNLTIETKTQLPNLTHIVWGHNGKEEDINPDEDNLYFIDTIQIHPLAKVWKLNTHSANAIPQMKVTYTFPSIIIPSTLRLIINIEDSVIYNNNSIVYTQSNINDTTITFDSIQFSNNAIYYLRIVAMGDSIYKPVTSKNSVIDNGVANSNENFVARVTPNPTNTGEFVFEVIQTEQTSMYVNITDAQGKIIYSESQNEPITHYTLKYRINNQGVYFINVTTPNNKKSVKLVVSK